MLHQAPSNSEVDALPFGFIFKHSNNGVLGAKLSPSPSHSFIKFPLQNTQLTMANDQTPINPQRKV